MAGPRARGLCTSKPTAGRGAKGTGRGCPGAHATPWPGLGPSILQCPAGVGGQGVSRSPGRRGPAVQQRQLAGGGGCGASPGAAADPASRRNPARAWPPHRPGAGGTEVLEAAADHRFGPILAAAQSRTGRGSEGAAWASGFLTADPSTSCRAWRTGARGRRGAEDTPSPPGLGPLPSPPHCLPLEVGTTPTSPPTESPAPRPGLPPTPRPPSPPLQVGKLRPGWPAFCTGLQVTRLCVQRPTQDGVSRDSDA